MKDSLLNLQRGIGLRDYSSEAEEKRSRYHWHTTTRPWGHAVQYRTCFVCEPVCRQQRDRQRGQRGRRDQQWAGPIDTKRGTVVSSAQRLKPPGGGNHGQKVPLSHTGTELSPNITEALWEGARLAPSLHLWDNPLPSILLFPSASYCKPRRPDSGREKEGKLLHAFRQPSSPQSVLMWSSSSLCVSKKKKKNRRRGEVESKKGGGVLFES